MNIGQKHFRQHRVGIKLNKIITAGNKMYPISTQSAGPIGHLVNDAIKNISNSSDIQNLPIKGYIPKVQSKKNYLIEKPRRSRAGSDDKYT